MKRWTEFTLWAAIVAVVVLRTVPGATWYDVGSAVRVHSETDFHLSFNGGPVRPFLGSYKVTVRSAVTRKVVAEGPWSGKFPYRPGAHRPEPPPLEWWVGSADTAGSIRALPPGDYFMDTCWTVHDPFYGMLITGLGSTPYPREDDPDAVPVNPFWAAIASAVASIAGDRNLCNRSLTFTIAPPP